MWRRPARCLRSCSVSMITTTCRAWRPTSTSPTKPSPAWRDGLAFAPSHPFRACSVLRDCTAGCRASRVEANLGFASDLPRLQGPWMALQP